MLTWRALVAGLMPGLVTFLVFWQSLRLSFAVSLIIGLAWTAVSLAVTRALYDDAGAELAAWQAEASDLVGWAAPVRDREITPAATVEPPGTPSGPEAVASAGASAAARPDTPER
jgi:hypothetical protein